MYERYDGYLPTNGKEPKRKFRNRLPLEAVQDLESYAGVLSKETVLIDIDDYEESEKLLRLVDELGVKCDVFETSRGKHFVLRNGDMLERCSTKSPLAVGLTADIKIGKKNSTQVLKIDGKLRKKIRTCDIPDVVPLWMKPLKSRSKKFVAMEEGDGRNQELFNYILTLQSNSLTVEECREVIRLINKYVLNEPLPDSELEVILRDESLQAPNFFKDGKFMHNEFGDFLIRNNHIIRINNQLHIYKEGVYVEGTEEIEGQMIDYCPTLKASQRTEVIKYINLVLRENSTPADAKYIAFKNGILDVETGDIQDFNPEFVITNKIGFNYNPKAESQLVHDTIERLACGDEQLVRLLEEVAGYCFYRRNELRKMFFLLGEKRNGKSTFLDMIQTMLGEDNVSNLDLKDIGDRFRTAEMHGKLANIGDDIGDAYISDSSILKKVASGDPVTAEKKGQDPFKFKPYNKMLFSANSIPRINDNSKAVLSRMVIIPFNATFGPDIPGFDPFLKDKLRKPESIEYLIRVGIEGLRRVLFAQKFTDSKQAEKALEEYEESNNPILKFFKEMKRTELIGTPIKDAYVQYQNWTDENGLKASSAISFGKSLCSHFGLRSAVKKVGGKTLRIYEEDK